MCHVGVVHAEELAVARAALLGNRVEEFGREFGAPLGVVLAAANRRGLEGDAQAVAVVAAALLGEGAVLEQVLESVVLLRGVSVGVAGVEEVVRRLGGVLHGAQQVGEPVAAVDVLAVVRAVAQVGEERVDDVVVVAGVPDRAVLVALPVVHATGQVGQEVGLERARLAARADQHRQRGALALVVGGDGVEPGVGEVAGGRVLARALGVGREGRARRRQEVLVELDVVGIVAVDHLTAREGAVVDRLDGVGELFGGDL
jgi:hypothetical protein